MKVIKQRPVLRIAFATLMVAALIAIVFTTPQGRAFAQSVLQFFIRTKSDQLPLQPWQLTPAPTPTIPPILLSMESAENQVGFDVREFIAVPEKLTLHGARVEGEVIYIDYTLVDSQCKLTLVQALSGNHPHASLWSRFPAAEIQTVKVGEFAGELAHDSSSRPPVVRLRWQEPDDGAPPPALIGPDSVWHSGTLSLELAQACPPDASGYLDDENLIYLAMRTVHTRYGDALVSTEQAESQAGFGALKLPEENAERFTRAGASADPQHRLLTLVYHSPDASWVQSGRTFTLKQWPITEPLETCDLCAAIGASADVLTVPVRGTSGEYVQGVWELSNDGPVWQPIPHRKIIRWQEDGYWFELGMYSSDGSHTMEDLIAVAEGLQ